MDSNVERIQSVLKALQIMEELDRHGSLGIREIAQSLDMGKSSVHRIVSTLKHAGWVVENKNTGKNELSYKLFSLGSNVVKRMSHRDFFHREMEKLGEATGENVNLGVLFRGEVFHVDKVESTSPIKVDAPLGTPTSAYNTALGKVLLAEMPEEEVRRLFQDCIFVKTGKNTILSLEELLRALEKVRSQGYARDNEEYADSMICYAVPIRNSEGRVEQALSVSFPKYRYEEKPEEMQRILEELIKTGRTLSREE
ncbi:MAG TPA: IclR family transcriptional regulator [Synergistaceae bacterium]|nr:IclR family transcriptional regulator [Synergistaceae bacterium]HPJ26574.1 IclR family transcriptional regulator [Synergistaceae bacterium]HPQ37735.1 IclR family transcriptional regulator [Synergistaceae bacterium]